MLLTLMTKKIKSQPTTLQDRYSSSHESALEILKTKSRMKRASLTTDYVTSEASQTDLLSDHLNV